MQNVFDDRASFDTIGNRLAYHFLPQQRVAQIEGNHGHGIVGNAYRQRIDIGGIPADIGDKGAVAQYGIIDLIQHHGGEQLIV